MSENITEVPMRGEITMKPADPMQVEYTMTITLSLTDWQALKQTLGTEMKYPQHKIRERIEDAIRQTTHIVRGRDDDGNATDPDEELKQDEDL